MLCLKYRSWGFKLLKLWSKREQIVQEINKINIYLVKDAEQSLRQDQRIVLQNQITGLNVSFGNQDNN